MTSPNETWAPPGNWTGPREDDLAADGVTLTRRVPVERWPYGPPSAHETCCNLFYKGLRGGLYCDCAASAEDDEDSGVGAWPGPVDRPVDGPSDGTGS